MSHTITSFHDVPRVISHVEDITIQHILVWLKKGWMDLTRAPAASLGYGLVFVIAGYLITLAVIFNNAFFLLLPIIAGFFIVAPTLGTGLYEISRSLEQGKPATFWLALCAWQKNAFHVLSMGAVNVVAFTAWILIANLLFATLFTGITPTWENFLPALFSLENLPLLIIGTLVGGVIAFAIFAISAVSVPMLLDHDIDLFSAIRVSVSAVRYNWRPMLLWAMMIVLIIAAGFLTLYVGLVILFPLVGHATWHAYRDMVKFKA